MITTPDLIEALAANVTPVRRLRPPLARATLWLSFAVVVLVLLAVSHGGRPDLAQRLHQPTFVVSIAASLLTGIFAALAQRERVLNGEDVVGRAGREHSPGRQRRAATAGARRPGRRCESAGGGRAAPLPPC